MGWLTYMANGSKQDLRSSCFFIERFAIRHQYKGLNMMVIQLFWWCLRGTHSKHRFKSVCYLKLGIFWDVKNKHLPGWYSRQGGIRDGRNTGWWLASWVGNTLSQMFIVVYVWKLIHILVVTFCTHTHTKKNEHFETEGIENTWGLTATQIVINHYSESFYCFSRDSPALPSICVSCHVDSISTKGTEGLGHV